MERGNVGDGGWGIGIGVGCLRVAQGRLGSGNQSGSHVCGELYRWEVKTYII